MQHAYFFLKGTQKYIIITILLLILWVVYTSQIPLSIDIVRAGLGSEPTKVPPIASGRGEGGVWSAGGGPEKRRTGAALCKTIAQST